MRNRVFFITLIVLTLAHDAAIHVWAGRTGQSEPSLAPIVRTERAGAGVVRIVYNLQGAPGALFVVSLEASSDGGQTFAIRPRATTGDVGPGIAVGTGKMITWDTSKDVDDLQIDRYVFRVVVATGEPGSASSSAPAPTRTAPPAGAGSGVAGARPAGGTTAGAKKGGGLSKGAIAALLGGGAAAGVGVALAGGKSAPPAGTSPSSTTTTTVPATDVTGTWLRTFTFSDPPVSGSVATLTFALTQTATAISGSVTITLGPPASGTDIRPVSGTVATSSPRVLLDNPIRSNPFTDRFGRPYGLCTEHYALDLSSDGSRLSGTVTQTADALCSTVGGSAPVTLNRR
jgi:hypothetical protein